MRPFLNAEHVAVSGGSNNNNGGNIVVKARLSTVKGNGGGLVLSCGSRSSGTGGRVHLACGTKKNGQGSSKIKIESSDVYSSNR